MVIMRKYALVVISLLTAAALLSGCSKNNEASLSQESSGSQSVYQNDSSKEDDEISEEESLEESDPEEDASTIYRFKTKYYVRQLSEDELKVFAKMYNTALRFGDKAEFRENISADTLDKLMWFLNYECPELIHLKGDYAPIYSDSEQQNVSGVMLFYCMEEDEYKENFKKLITFFGKLKKDTEGKTDYEKEKYVYDLIFRDCVYDEVAENAGSAYGALIECRGRCEGISKSFMWCMRELNFECLTVVGKPTWDSEAVYSNHSWNILKLDGDFYHVDIATDNLQSDTEKNNPPLYGFLNVDDDYLYATRTPDSYYTSMGLPECNSDKYNYHKMNGLFIESGSAVQEKFYEIMDNHYVDGAVNNISIRLESREDYNSSLDYWETWLSDYITTNSYQTCYDTIYYNDVANAVIIHTEMPVDIS